MNIKYYFRFETIMTILDKLIEKKDIRIYIDYRIKELQLQLQFKDNSVPDKHKHNIRYKLNGRISELRRLKQLLHENKVRKESKRCFNKFKLKG